MLRKFTKKRALIAISVIAVLATAGSALAYFTSTGSGTGSATVGHSTAFTVGETGTPTGGPLYPEVIGGANIQTDSYTVTNGGSGSQNLTSVTISVANSDGSAWTSQTSAGKPACTAADFSVNGKPIGIASTDNTLAGTIAAGQSSATGHVTVEMIDNGANQDNCQNVTVPLYFSAS